MFSLVPPLPGWNAGRGNTPACPTWSRCVCQGELASLVPGQRVPQELGQVLHFPDDVACWTCLASARRQVVQEDREPCQAFHERADRAFVRPRCRSGRLPMTGYRPVPRLRRAAR